MSFRKGFSFPVWMMAGGFALFSSWLWTGCRLGNHVAYQGAENEVVQKKLSGYYKTEPETVSFCVQKKSTQKNKCQEQTLSDIPELFKKVMTQPVGFLVLKKKTTSDIREAVIFNPYYKKNIPHLPIYVERTTHRLGLVAQTTWKAFWENETQCKNRLELKASGLLKPFASKKQDGDFQIRGQMILKWVFQYRYQGKVCASVFQKMSECILELMQCPGGKDLQQKRKWQQVASEQLGGFLKNKILDPSDFKDLSVLETDLYYH